MIERYSREKIKNIWTLDNKFQKWLDIEVAACEAHETLDNIPTEDLKIIQEKAKFTMTLLHLQRLWQNLLDLLLATYI